MEFSNQVRLVREKLNLSQEDLARELNVSYATVSRWEHGKAKPIKLARDVFAAFCKKNGIVFD